MKYKERIARVVSYIRDNYHKTITLGELADIAHFSLYHFSRLFTSFQGMPPMKYVNKVRLEKAAALLINNDLSISEIAFSCGFESLSSFNTQFKKHYCDTPSGIRKKSKNQHVLSKHLKDNVPASAYINTTSFIRRMWDMHVTIEQFPPYEIAYFRHVGSYLKTAANWERLLKWTIEHHLYEHHPQFIGVSHDDPATTSEDACRHDACVVLPPGFYKNQEGGVTYGRLPGGLYGVYFFYDTIEKLAIIYNTLFCQWLPGSGYEIDNRPAMEINLNNPADDPERKSKCKVCLPIKEE
jgi:AraC family transcriptional regulator